jgi:hypothetical protein
LDSRLQDEILDRIKENSRWMLNEDELENIPVKHGGKSKTPKPIDPNHYNKMIQELLNSPLNYQDKIHGLMKRFYNLRDSTHRFLSSIMLVLRSQIENSLFLDVIDSFF